SVCNALDTILVHKEIATAFIPKAAQRMAANNVSLKADERALTILNGNGHSASYEAAGPNDWDTEWMDLILGIKVIDTLDEAIEHIADHSLDHSDSIVTNNWSNATRFVNEVNSSAVFVNASTRFNDGGEFGLGAEVAVSTQKLHARGPMGLEELTTYKWVVFGEGHVRP
ncbi:MAG: gamma-glutamyl-phosphate reductase, partial [Chloroflexota bacterium]